ncbi:hypothetical protein BAAA27536_04205 [Bifidobacterium animalis subsp. lactis ATCC 27536]|nr:hypothetical protein BAAA27536_04205 [Bifidobacterium animalis subsp. lactis ATCC 27536]KOA51430.1 hypothetical protein BAAA27674_03590 [Bifidobacterium animalis subsp. lactis ATCC 27674]
MLRIVQMEARIRGIAAIVSHHEHVPLAHGDLEREGAGLVPGLDIRGFVNRHAVDFHRLARPLALHRVAGHADQSFDQVVAVIGGLLAREPVGRVFEHHNVAAFERDRPRGELGGDHTVAWHDRVLHGA